MREKLLACSAKFGASLFEFLARRLKEKGTRSDDRTYSASRLLDEVPGPISPGCSLFAPSARQRKPRFLIENIRSSASHRL